MLATIKTKKEIATGTLYVEYALQSEDLPFKSGQFFFVSLKNPHYNDERGARRHFSIVNPPEEKGIIAMATRITESAFKRSLQELPVGTEVEIGPVGGNFVLPGDVLQPIVFIAGGIGVTPFISMLRHVQLKKLPYNITLIYSNRDQQSTAFLEELQTMEKTIPHFKLFATMTQDPAWTGLTGRIDAAFIKSNFPNVNGYRYFVAGPPAMVQTLSNVLVECNIEMTHIMTENFVGY